MAGGGGGMNDQWRQMIILAVMAAVVRVNNDKDRKDSNIDMAGKVRHHTADEYTYTSAV